MDTREISYRVADFLKTHVPFQSMQERDLLDLAAHGRVRFYEANEYVLWQGEPHKSHVFVIQQGTVSFWDESDGATAMRDVRGAGDMLGMEQFNEAPCVLYSARSESDVVIYSFPASDFQTLVLKYPHARRFVEAYDAVSVDYQWVEDARDPQKTFLHELVSGKTPLTCRTDTTVRDVAQTMLSLGADALAVVDGEGRMHGIVTGDTVLAWVASGAGNAGQPITVVPWSAPPAVGPAASVVDGALAVADADAAALAVTSDGTSTGQLHALVTRADIARGFGDEPTAILRGIRIATTTRELRALNRRARALALQYMPSAASIDWLARFVTLVDAQVIAQLLALLNADVPSACWCVCGASGRRESLTRHTPQLVLITDDDRARPAALQAFERMTDGLLECDYLARSEMEFDRAFYVAGTAEWQARYQYWLQDPVRAEMYRARPMFDLRPMEGTEALWHAVADTVGVAADREFLQVLANDCLGNLPPLTFFQDAVVEKSGEQTTVFRLEQSALRPLVEVGRVFGLAARRALGTSTRERFAGARTLLPEHESIFRDASETLRVLLWQQARIGIDQDTSGSELPPRLLSRHDRHVLRSGFQSILRLLDFANNTPWWNAV